MPFILPPEPPAITTPAPTPSTPVQAAPTKSTTTTTTSRPDSFNAQHVAPKPAPKASANDTVVKAGSTASIVDASGNTWTITAAGLVAVNGVADQSTAHVIELAYVGGTVWQENASKLWWGKTKPTAAWLPANGTATSPLPPAVTCQ